VAFYPFDELASQEKFFKGIDGRFPKPIRRRTPQMLITAVVMLAAVVIFGLIMKSRNSKKDPYRRSNGYHACDADGTE